MPLERPLREPIIGADGQMSRRWKEFFAGLDEGSNTSASFEAESRLTAGGLDTSGDVRRIKAQQREPVPFPAQDRRVSRMHAMLRELKFLES